MSGGRHIVRPNKLNSTRNCAEIIRRDLLAVFPSS